MRESEARIHLLMTSKALDEGGGALNVRLKVCVCMFCVSLRSPPIVNTFLEYLVYV